MEDIKNSTKTGLTAEMSITDQFQSTARLYLSDLYEMCKSPGQTYMQSRMSLKQRPLQMQVYSMFPYFPTKNRSPSDNVSMVKNVQTYRYFKFYFGKLNNKHCPIWCNVSFESVFTAINKRNKQ